jgi:hypothetical protein
MGMIFEDLEDHEGYAARRLPDGTLTSTWTQDTAAFEARVGACTCGWTGTKQHPASETGSTAAEDEWKHAHAGPLLAVAVPARITELVDNLREETVQLADHRPLAARAVAQRLIAWSEHIMQLTKAAELHVTSAPWVITGLNADCRSRSRARGRMGSRTAWLTEQAPAMGRTSR